MPLQTVNVFSVLGGFAPCRSEISKVTPVQQHGRNSTLGKMYTHLFSIFFFFFSFVSPNNKVLEVSSQGQGHRTKESIKQNFFQDV